MSPLLPPERLREIRERVEDATPGPWEFGMIDERTLEWAVLIAYARAAGAENYRQAHDWTLRALLDALETAEAERDIALVELNQAREEYASCRASADEQADDLEDAESLVMILGAALQAVKADRPSAHSDAVWEQLNAALTQFQEFQSALAPTQPEGGSE